MYKPPPGHYIRDLAQRLDQAIDTSRDRLENPDDFSRRELEDGDEVPLLDLAHQPTRTDSAFNLMDWRADLDRLGATSGQLDLDWMISCWLLVAGHSALEHFCERVGLSGRTLPATIWPSLLRRKDLDSIGFVAARTRALLWEPTDEDAVFLARMDAARHAIVHNRGLVDAKYLRTITAAGLTTGLEPDERVTVGRADVTGFLDLTERVAYHILYFAG